MSKINFIEKKITNKKRLISLIEPSKLLADFFNGVVVEVKGKYIYEP